MGTDSASEEPEADAEAEPEEKTSKSKDKLLFKANTKFPHKKLITMSRAEDLQVSLGYRAEDGTSTAEPISTFNISGVSSAVRPRPEASRLPLAPVPEPPSHLSHDRCVLAAHASLTAAGRAALQGPQKDSHGKAEALSHLCSFCLGPARGVQV